MATTPEVQREDLTAVVGARRKLGPDSEREVVEAFPDPVGTGHPRARRSAPGRQARAVGEPRRGPARGWLMGIGIAATGAASGLDYGRARRDRS